MNQKKTQSLPINVVVMMILGIIILGLGISLFTKFLNQGNEKITNLNSEIRDSISSLECGSNEWICSPAYKMFNGENKFFNIYVVNNDNRVKDFSISINTESLDGDKEVITNDCGSLIINYYKNTLKIPSGMSRKFPFQIIATRVSKTPCSFIKTIILNTNDAGDQQKTSLIINVQS